MAGSVEEQLANHFSGSSGSSGSVRKSSSYWLRKFNECSILQRPVRRLMEDFAAVEFSLKRKSKGEFGETVFEDVEEHPVIDLLFRKPNPRMSSQQFFETWEQMLTLTGHFFVYVEKKGSLPVALWPIATDKMARTPATSGNGKWSFTGSKGNLVEVGSEDILWDRLPDACDLYGHGHGYGDSFHGSFVGGSGLCSGIVRQIETWEAATDWSRHFFENGSSVGTIVGIPNLEPEHRKALEQHWQKNHTGLKNAHKTLFLTISGDGKNKVSVDKLGAVHRDLDYVQGIESLKDQVRENFNLPAELLGDSKTSNRASSLASENFHQRHNIRPRAQRAKNLLNCFFLPMFGDPGLVIDYVDPVKEDAEFAHRSMMDAIKNGTANRNDWRKMRGLTPRDGVLFEAYSIPLNMWILDAKGNLLVAPGVEADELQPPEPEGDQADQDRGVTR